MIILLSKLAVEVIQKSTGVLRRRLTFNTASKHTIVKQFSLVNVANVVILDRKVVIGAHLACIIVSFPGERKLTFEVVDGELVIAQLSIGHTDLLSHPHLLLE